MENLGTLLFLDTGDSKMKPSIIERLYVELFFLRKMLSTVPYVLSALTLN